MTQKPPSSSRTPKKFVGLHNHTTVGSIGDAIGTPFDHLSFARENGLDAHAITDHGNMNSYSYGIHAIKKMGSGIKYIPGIEAYFHPDLKQWAVDKASSDETKRVERELAKQEKLAAAEKKAKKSAGDSPEEIVDAAIGDAFAEQMKDLQESLGITKEDTGDDDNEEGGTAIENEEETKSKRVFDPIKRRHHLVLLAKNSEGLKSLFKLTSKSFVEGFYRFPRMDFADLKREAHGNIVASSACVGGALADAIFRRQTEGDWLSYEIGKDDFEAVQADLKEIIERFQDALGKENFYTEIQFNSLKAQHLVNYHLIEASKRTGSPLVVTCDAHYSNPAHWREREIYKMMAWMSRSKTGPDKSKLPKIIDEMSCELYPKNADQVWGSYKKYCEGYSFYDDSIVCDAIERTHTIAHEQIERPEINRSVKLPSITKLVSSNDIEEYTKLKPDSSEDDIAFKALLEICKVKLVEKKLHTKKEYIDRLKQELDDVKFLKFSKYFLTYYVIMREVSAQLLTGSGRGSAAGSLVSYLLNITQVDPLRYGTLWQRFITKTKKGYPDIDSDSSDRDEATKIIKQYFGEDNVISVSSYSQLQVASLIKDLAKIYDVPFETVNTYTYKMKAEALAEAKKKPGFDAGVWQFTLEEAEKYSPSYREFMELMSEHPEFKQALFVLFKQVRGLGKHAGGVCITDDALGSMPVIRAKGGLQTPWPEGVNARHLEDFGFLKFDILGLGTLRVIESTIRKVIKKETGKTPTFSDVRAWFNQHLHPDNNKFEDMKVYKHIFWDKNFAGIFQFIDPKVQDYVSNVKPTSIFDLAAVTSIFRPGPLGLGSDKDYISRKLSGKTTFAHPLLESVLGDTFGTIIYQEHLQLIYHKMAGIPLEDTDAVRKAFTKKDMANKDKAEAERLRLRQEFVKLCKENNNVSEMITSKIFDDMDKCAAYLFNKSHAIAYTICSYQCAHMLTYYPDEWITSYIDYCANGKGKVTGGEDPKAVAIKEAKALGYSFGKPDINLSENEYTINVAGGVKTLIPSFSSLKYVGQGVQREIHDYRPYKNLEDLLWVENSLHTIWKHSKFNKRAMGVLIQMEAFDSLELVGPEDDKLFKNYRQLYEVVVVNGEQIKKALARKKNRNHKELLAQFIEEAQKLEDWTTDEKLQFRLLLSGSLDRSLIMTPEIEAFLEENNIQGIETWENPDQNYWAIVSSAVISKTSTGKTYLKMKLMGSGGAEFACSVWNFKPLREQPPGVNKVIVGSFKKDNYGLSAFLKNIMVLETKSDEGEESGGTTKKT